MLAKAENVVFNVYMMHRWGFGIGSGIEQTVEYLFSPSNDEDSLLTQCNTRGSRVQIAANRIK